MRILTVDVGTGTQDIFLYDSCLDLENGLKLVVPSPTLTINRRMKQATASGKDVVLTGVTMGGGPSDWATTAHIRAGHKVYATPDAARSFNDDLDFLQREMGLTVVGEEEAALLIAGNHVVDIELKDFDLPAIVASLAAFGYHLDVDAIGVAVFDHGNAPPGISDRQFRFDYLNQRLQLCNQLSTFAFRADEVPPIMTRMQSVLQNYQGDVPLLVTDTAPAAIAGAMLDPLVQSRHRVLIANVGNYHTLACRVNKSGEIEGMFEHHTGELDRNRMDDLLSALADSSITHEDVFGDMGHGALLYSSAPLPLRTNGEWGVAITGPRRKLMCGSRHRPYFAVPYGDMMLTGCFGILRLMADVMPEFQPIILESLKGKTGAMPWDTVP